MFRNYLAAALRNMARNRFYTAINIVGLTVGLTAALLIALFVLDEFSYDRWIPGYESVFRVSQSLGIPDRPRAPDVWDRATPGHIGPWLKTDFPEIETVARLADPPSHPKTSNVSFRHNDL